MGPARTGWIIKITRLGDKIPQEISGGLFNTNTGNFSDTENGFPVFACEIQEELSEKEREGLLTEFTKKLNSFLGHH